MMKGKIKTKSSFSKTQLLEEFTIPLHKNYECLCQGYKDLV